MANFTLSEIEKKAAEAWIKRHSKKCNLKKLDSSIGGRWSYRFIPCSIGVSVIIRCVCGKCKNITDFSCW
jgi:hypothetical protein